MLNQFSRTQLLLGESAMQELANKRVAVFGIGGVGGYACEALVRSGIGAFDLIDDDKVCLTNLNRQIIATRKTVGKYKTEVMKERMLEINPNVDVRIHNCFFLPENADEFPFDEYDYIWVLVTSWTRQHSGLQIYIRQGCVLLRRLCAVNLRNVALRSLRLYIQKNSQQGQSRICR